MALLLQNWNPIPPRKSTPFLSRTSRTPTSTTPANQNFSIQVLLLFMFVHTWNVLPLAGFFWWSQMCQCGWHCTRWTLQKEATTFQYASHLERRAAKAYAEAKLQKHPCLLVGWRPSLVGSALPVWSSNAARDPIREFLTSLSFAGHHSEKQLWCNITAMSWPASAEGKGLQHICHLEPSGQKKDSSLAEYDYQYAKYTNIPI